MRERRGVWSRREQDWRLSERREGRWESSWVRAGRERERERENSQNFIPGITVGVKKHQHSYPTFSYSNLTYLFTSKLHVTVG